MIVQTNLHRVSIQKETRSTTAVDPGHLKDKEDISLTKNYCIKSAQFINSFLRNNRF